jgi:hypothetical protein
MTSSEALAKLLDGNKRFTGGERSDAVTSADLTAMVEG